jgi:hypothetical protein
VDRVDKDTYRPKVWCRKLVVANVGPFLCCPHKNDPLGGDSSIPT